MSCGNSAEHNPNRRFVSEVSKATGIPNKDISDLFHDMVEEWKAERGIPFGGGTTEQQTEAENWARVNLDYRASQIERCPADGHWLRPGHACPPTKLRSFAKEQDAITAELYEQHYKEQEQLEQTANYMRKSVGQKLEGHGRDQRWTGTVAEAYEQAKRTLADAEAASGAERTYREQADLDLLKKRVAAYETARKAYKATGAQIEAQDATHRKLGWTRAFLVLTNGEGHVHRSMSCSTTYPTTRFAWLPEYSGDSEENIVEDAGKRACSVCYKSAPVETFSRPTKIYSEGERQQMADREARAKASADRNTKAAENSVDGSGDEFSVVVAREVSHQTGKPYERKEWFKTERSASIWAVDALASPYRPEPTPTEREAVERIASAIAGKRGVEPAEVMAEFEKKAAAKRKKNEKEAEKFRAQNPQFFKD